MPPPQWKRITRAERARIRYHFNSLPLKQSRAHRASRTADKFGVCSATVLKVVGNTYLDDVERDARYMGERARAAGSAGKSGGPPPLRRRSDARNHDSDDSSEEEPSMRTAARQVRPRTDTGRDSKAQHAPSPARRAVPPLPQRHTDNAPSTSPRADSVPARAHPTSTPRSTADAPAVGRLRSPTAPAICQDWRTTEPQPSVGEVPESSLGHPGAAPSRHTTTISHPPLNAFGTPDRPEYFMMLGTYRYAFVQGLKVGERRAKKAVSRG